MRILTRDPCLLSTGNGANNVKSSKALLTNFAKDYLSGDGDIEKHLRQLRFRVEHEQSILSEVDFSVTNLAVDLRDGVRLAKLVDIVLKRHDTCSALRMPAVSGAADRRVWKRHHCCCDWRHHCFCDHSVTWHRHVYHGHASGCDCPRHHGVDDARLCVCRVCVTGAGRSGHRRHVAHFGCRRFGR